MSKIRIIVSFNIYHKYIVTYLCEKRDDPQNHCNGKCWLKKEFNKTEDWDVNQLPTSKTSIPENIYIYQCNECRMRDKLAYGNFKYETYDKQIHTSGFIGDIFHPPRRTSV